VPEVKWTMLTKRTNDPKLAWLENRLHDMGIETRRSGESWHAPIMEVPAEHHQKAWDFLGSPFDESGQSVDDVEDNDPVFEELL
jgi:hypothetical protein